MVMTTGAVWRAGPAVGICDLTEDRVVVGARVFFYEPLLRKYPEHGLKLLSELPDDL